MDKIKMAAYFLVFGLKIYGKSYVNIDEGKDNMASYFIKKKGWSTKRLKRAIKALRQDGLLNHVKCDTSGCYSTSAYKSHIKIMLNISKL